MCVISSYRDAVGALDILYCTYNYNRRLRNPLARPPTSRPLLVGKSKCAFQASARSQRVVNNIFFVTEIATQYKISYKYYQQLPCIDYKSLNFTEITNLSFRMNPSQNLALNLASSPNSMKIQDLTPDRDLIPDLILN